MNMRRLSILLFSVCLAFNALAQKAPSHELGFKPERVYQFSGIDSVNLLNGNLTVNVPIGLRYPLSSTFSYQLQLVYNGKMWDYETWTDNDGSWSVARPNLRSNAGVGWRVTLGQLLEPHNPTVELYQSEIRHGYVYESPTGAEYPFVSWLATENPPAQPDAEDALIQFNADGKLRMLKIDASTRKIEFPTGEIHTFKKDANGKWRLDRQEDRFGNWLQVTYTPDTAGRDAYWVISDSAGRAHTITFTHKTALSDTTMEGQVVSRIDFDGQSVPHSFIYVDRDVEYGCGHNRPVNTPPTSPDTTTTTRMPMLEAVTLPDGTSFKLQYHLTSVNECSQGALQRLTFPTGGYYDYVYQKYALQMSICGQTPWIDLPVGLKSKTTSEGHTWDYVQHAGPEVQVYTPPQDAFCGTGEGGNNLMPVPPNRWVRTSVLSPVTATTHSDGILRSTRTRTDNYFHWWNADRADPLLGTLPPAQVKAAMGGVTGAPSATTSQGGYLNDGPDVLATDSSDIATRRFLSMRVFENCATDRSGNCSGPDGRLVRTTYVRGWPDRNGQLLPSDSIESSRTEFNDDTGCGGVCSTTTTYSDRNSVGQSRVTTVETNFPNTEKGSAYTAYPDWTAADLRDTSPTTTRKWIFEKYSEVKRTQGEQSHRTLYCFSADGLLERTRKLAGANAGPRDLVSVFEWQGGNLTFESSYGGDQLSPADTQNVGTSSSCTASLPSAPMYRVGHTYTYGVLNKSTYYANGQPLTFSVVDRTIEGVTGSVTTDRDTAGVATGYGYQASTARLTTIDPPGAAITNISYTNPTETTLARVDVATSATGAGTLLHEQTTFDSFGRVLRQSRLTPNSQWVATQSSYDGLGRTATVTVPVSTGSAPPTSNIAGSVTVYEYDAFGRPLRVTAPDGSITRFVRTGTRRIIRYTRIGTGVGTQQEVATTEEYDGFGRLIRVIEKSGPTSATSPIGADVTTEYRYDVSNNLISVVMRGSDGVVQNRLFDYDGRGFLRWESQPEAGITSYLYDARGHVASKTQGAANSIFDLKYTYDAAERLIRIDGRNPLFGPEYPTEPEFRIVKSFEFGMANVAATPTDYQRGKLLRSARYNYDDVYHYEPTYKIEHTYAYNDTAATGSLRGRTTKISTIADGIETVVKTVSMEVERNELNLVKRVLYPTCENCGAPPVSPQRDLQYTYDAGRLKTVPGYVSTVSYWPNGLRNVLPHANGIADTQVSGDMARPTSLSFGVYDRCVQPTFTVQPMSTSADSNGNATLLPSVTGTTPFVYEWYERPFTLVGTSLQLNLQSLTQTKEYFLIVRNECGSTQSQTAKVTVGACSPPSTGQIKAIAQPDGSWLLRPDPTARNPRWFNWRRVSDNELIGSTETLLLPPPTVTTTYRLTISDDCGSHSSDVTITVPLPAPANLVATWGAPALQVNLTWSAVAGASGYAIQRRSGAEWEDLATTTGTSFTDVSVVASRTYAYRVSATGSGSQTPSTYSQSDVATTMTFPQAVSGADVSSAPIDGMLNAVNKVRAAAGWPAVTWSTILVASDPLPAPGQLIMARHITACRARMNEALQALGARAFTYTDGTLEALELRAQYVNEVQGRAD